MLKSRSHIMAAAAPMLAAMAVSPAPVAAQQVGTAGAVNPAAEASGRVLRVGSNVLFRERVNTTSTGSVQLIFIDKTTLSIGPNSNVVIDEFVYNPNAGTGRMTISLGKGLLRIVGGNVTHTEGATIKTPVATIGVRGGVNTTSHQNGVTNVMNHVGTSTVTSGGTTQSIYRPGFGSSVGSAGSPPSTPQPVPPAVIDTTMKQLTSAPGQTGGTAKQPTGATVAASGLGQTNANLVPSQIVSKQNQIISQSVIALPPTTVANVDQITQLGQQQFISEQVVQKTAPAPTFFALQTTGIPYLPASGFTTPGMYVSPLLGYRPGGLLDNGDGRFGSATLQAGLAITEDEYGNQASTFFVMSGGFVSLSADGSDQIHSAGFRATTRLASDEPMGAARGSADSVLGSEVLSADRIPIAVTLSQDARDPLTGAVTPEMAFFFNPNTDYTYSNAFTQIPVPAGVGESRSGEQLTGFIGGVMRTRHASSVGAPSSVNVGPSFPVVGGLVIDFELNRPRFQAVATIEKVANFNGDTNEFLNAVLQIGNLSATARSRGSFIDDNLFGGREAVNEPPGVEPQTQVSTVNGGPTRRTGQAFATSKLVNAEGAILALDPGATFCVCEYTRWGAWSVDSYRVNSDMTTEERDRAHLMLWVAGRKSDPVDIPLVGKATYNGYLAGTIKNMANEYLAGSNFSYTANFGAPASSTMSVADLDGVTYSGNLPFVRATNTISGSITGTNVSPYGPLTGSATMNLEGAFFKGKTDPIKDVAGRFHITGNPVGPEHKYIGAGIFAGSR